VAVAAPVIPPVVFGVLVVDWAVEFCEALDGFSPIAGLVDVAADPV